MARPKRLADVARRSTIVCISSRVCATRAQSSANRSSFISDTDILDFDVGGGG